MAEAAAETLHNTPTVARNSYIHPAVIDLAEIDADERTELFRTLSPAGPSALYSSERRLLGFLEV